MWFKVDDGFCMNPKTAMLSNDATALWLRSGTWAAQQLTKGRVPANMIPMFRCSDDSVQELCDAACGSMTPTRTNTCSMIGLTISRTVTKWMPSAGSGVKLARRVRAVVGRSPRMAKMANRWQMLWQTHGKPMANAWQTDGKRMARRWQTDGKRMPRTRTRTR